MNPFDRPVAEAFASCCGVDLAGRNFGGGGLGFGVGGSLGFEPEWWLSGFEPD
ncbi:MAG: hypothetical protein WB974_14225 [Acidobacteriaceae bacterium]